MIMNKSIDNIEFVEDRPGHDFRYSLNSTKAKKELDWKVETKFDIGIEKTVKWYLQNMNWVKQMPNNVLDPEPWKK